MTTEAAQERMTDTEDTMTSTLPTGRQPWMSARLSRAITAVLALVVLVAAALVVYELVSVRPRYLDARAEDQARTEAVQSAERFVVEANNFDASDLPTLKQRISPMLTTKFRTDFESTIDDILAQIEQAQLVSKGEVLRSAVASVDSDSAEVLVVADANAQSSFGTRARHFRWSVDLVQVDGRWLVDNFTPVA
jgi:Mce-associated membrane protein